MEAKLNNNPEERLFANLFEELIEDKKSEGLINFLAKEDPCCKYFDAHPEEVVACDDDPDGPDAEEMLHGSQSYVLKICLIAEGLNERGRKVYFPHLSDYYRAPAEAWIARSQEIHNYLNEKEISFLKEVIKHVWGDERRYQER